MPPSNVDAAPKANAVYVPPYLSGTGLGRRASQVASHEVRGPEKAVEGMIPGADLQSRSLDEEPGQAERNLRYACTDAIRLAGLMLQPSDADIGNLLKSLEAVVDAKTEYGPGRPARVSKDGEQASLTVRYLKVLESTVKLVDYRAAKNDLLLGNLEKLCSTLGFKGAETLVQARRRALALVPAPIADEMSPSDDDLFESDIDEEPPSTVDGVFKKRLTDAIGQAAGWRGDDTYVATIPATEWRAFRRAQCYLHEPTGERTRIDTSNPEAAQKQLRDWLKENGDLAPALIAFPSAHEKALAQATAWDRSPVTMDGKPGSLAGRSEANFHFHRSHAGARVVCMHTTSDATHFMPADSNARVVLRNGGANVTYGATVLGDRTVVMTVPVACSMSVAMADPWSERNGKTYRRPVDGRDLCGRDGADALRRDLRPFCKGEDADRKFAFLEQVEQYERSDQPTLAQVQQILAGADFVPEFTKTSIVSKVTKDGDPLTDREMRNLFLRARMEIQDELFAEGAKAYFEAHPDPA